MTTARIPVTLLTGFLGSGKTTLLNAWVKQPAFARSLIIVNEFGDVALDHLLVAHSAEQSVVELPGGCLCCTVRGDLQKTLLDARWRFARGGQRQFDRVLIETTGLADPAPIINTLAANDQLARHYQWQGVVTTVDAGQGEATLKRFAEARRQVAFADLVLITKVDDSDPATIDDLTQEIRAQNPAASVLPIRMPPVAEDIADRLFSALTAITEGDAHVLSVRSAPGQPSGLLIRKIHPMMNTEIGESSHVEAMTSFSWVSDQPVTPEKLAVWWAFVQLRANERLLRLKALIRTTEKPEPKLMQVVQHRVHPTVTLADWPTPDHRNRIIAIGESAVVAELARATEALGSAPTI